MKGWVEFQDTEKSPGIVINVEAIEPEKAPHADSCGTDVKPYLAETLAKGKRGTDETCWETPDGQVECWKAKVKRGTDETCWETPDGQVECWKAKVKRGTDETCWETPDGQVECWKPKEKRDSEETCWETPDGQVECWKPKEKRGTDETCWETPDGQVECWKPKEKRGTDETCWETPDGQVECWKGKDKRAASAEPRGEVYSPGLTDNIVQLVGILPPPGPIADGTTTQCAGWWLAGNLTAEPAQCLSALVAGQNITFAQFRKLNPSVNFNCSNLHIGCAYCTQGISPMISAIPIIIPNGIPPKPAEPKPYLPAILVTERRTGPGIFGRRSFVVVHAVTSSQSTSGWNTLPLPAQDTALPTFASPSLAITAQSYASSAVSALNCAAASSTAGLADTGVAGSNDDSSWSGSLSYTTLFPPWNSSAAASQWSCQSATATGAPLPLAEATSVSSTAAASPSIASAADTTVPWSSSVGNYSFTPSFPSSTAPSLPIPQPPNIIYTSSAEYAHVSLAAPSHIDYTSSAEFVHVSLLASSTLATVTSGLPSKA
ncbi:MAG: hypothetical protein Q9202_002839 [Teloschistes flavicans]